MAHKYYSERTGVNPNSKGLPLADIIDMFVKVFQEFEEDGYFQEAFGYDCVDNGQVDGNIRNIPLDILLTIRKKELWPIESHYFEYSEDDFFDIVEYLHQHVSKPVDGTYHSWNECGWHYNSFNIKQGRSAYRDKTNSILDHYINQFELSPEGEILHKPEDGLKPVIKAKIPSDDTKVVDRIDAAILLYQRQKSSIIDRRHAVNELANVLEILRPKMKSVLDKKDEADLFNIANNFGIRHHNDKQKTDYDEPLWLGWMFYFYLITIHVVLRKINSEQSSQNAQK